MPSIDYDIKSKKIRRKFSPQWSKIGNNEEKLQMHVHSLIQRNKSMVEYIELLHNEIDRLRALECNQIEPHFD